MTCLNNIPQTVFASSVLEATPVTITIYDSSWHADTFQKKFTIKNPQPVPSKVTVSIISPPPKKGGDDLKSSARPHKKPMPVGPHILWPGCESWFWYNKLLHPNIELRVMRSIIVRLMNYQQAEQWIAWGVAFLDLEPFLPLILINTSAKV